MNNEFEEWYNVFVQDNTNIMTSKVLAEAAFIAGQEHMVISSYYSGNYCPHYKTEITTVMCENCDCIKSKLIKKSSNYYMREEL